MHSLNLAHRSLDIDPASKAVKLCTIAASEIKIIEHRTRLNSRWMNEPEDAAAESDMSATSAYKGQQAHTVKKSILRLKGSSRSVLVCTALPLRTYLVGSNPVHVEVELEFVLGVLLALDWEESRDNRSPSAEQCICRAEATLVRFGRRRQSRGLDRLIDSVHL